MMVNDVLTANDWLKGTKRYGAGREECLQAQEATEMTTSNQVSE